MSNHKHILLFDSACSKCSALAACASEIGSDKLRIESLHNPEMQATLSMVLPGWRWQPTLLVIQNSRIKAYVGREMQLQLLRILGVRKSIHLATEAQKQQMLSQPSSSTRRRFLVFTPILALSALSTSRTVFAGAPDKHAEERLRLEREIGGFILLNEGEALPSFVQGPSRPLPIVCGLGDENAQKMGRNVDVEEFAGSDDLLLKTRKPTDVLDPKQVASLGFVLKRATIFRYLSDGEEYSISFEYVRSVSSGENSDQSIWIHAARYPFKPIPMWQQETDPEKGQLESIRYTPETLENRQFLHLTTPREAFYHWFDGATHFTLQASASILNSELEQLLQSLKRFN